jgi:hypothetical protein
MHHLSGLINKSNMEHGTWNMEQTTWGKVKRETEEVYLTEQVLSLLQTGKVKDPETVVNAFNDLILSVTESLN